MAVITGAVLEAYGTSGAATDAFPTMPNRNYIMVQNTAAAGGTPIFVRFGATASAVAGARIEAGGQIELSVGGTGWVPSGRVSVFGTGSTFAAWQDAP